MARIDKHGQIIRDGNPPPPSTGSAQPPNAGGSASCFVVTATYGMNSRQSRQVHARCRRTFVWNPLLAIGWCLYKYYGPLLAAWSRSSRTGYSTCKRLLADPIIFATGKPSVVSVLSVLYLSVLTLIGVVLIVPVVTVRSLVRLFQIGR